MLGAGKCQGSHEQPCTLRRDPVHGRYRSGGLIKFEPLHLEAIPRVEPQPPTLITPDIQKPARASPLMKRKCVTSVPLIGPSQEIEAYRCLGSINPYCRSEPLVLDKVLVGHNQAFSQFSGSFPPQ